MAAHEATRGATKKRGLGRGLDALIPKAEPKPDEPVRTPPGRIEPAPQPLPAAHATSTTRRIEDLAASIRAQGIIQPLVVTPRGEGYAIIAGERRWRAARKAGLEAVPVVVRQVADDRELLELALVENLQRSDLNPIEEAEAYAALQEKFGLSQEEVAARVGKAPHHGHQLAAPAAPARRGARPAARGAAHRRPGAPAARPRGPGGADPSRRPRRARRALRPRSRAAHRRPGRRGRSRRSRTVRSRSIPPPPRSASPAGCRPGSRSSARAGGQRGQLRIHFHSEEELMRLFDVLIERGENR